jgi:hypothetical protein
MKRLYPLIFVFSILWGCHVKGYIPEHTTGYIEQKPAKFVVFVYQHPDYDFKAIDPNEIVIYDLFIPIKSYFIMGRISINDTPGYNEVEEVREIKVKSAAIGGQAVLIFASEIEEKEFEREKKITFAIPGNDYIAFLEWKIDNNITVSIRRRFGYVIRWKD